MPSRQVAAFNPTLTNYAQGVAQDLSSAIAEFIAPTVTVSATIGQYKSYDNKNAFQTYDSSRAVGGTARRIFMDASDPTYNCIPNALEIAIDDAERDAAGDGDPLVLEQAKVKTLVQASMTSHEKAVVDAIKNAENAVSGVGAWSTDTNDPIKELDAQIEAIAKETGQMPNAIVMGVDAWRLFRNNAKVRDRQPGAELIGLTTGQAGSMLLNPAMEIKIAPLVADGSKQGKAANKAFISGGECFVFVRSASPTIYDPSFAKVFAGARGGVTSVRSYRDESSRSDIYAVDWSRDIKVTSPISGSRITVS